MLRGESLAQQRRVKMIFFGVGGMKKDRLKKQMVGAYLPVKNLLGKT